MNVAVLEPSWTHSQMAAEGVRHRQEQQQPDDSMRESEHVQVVHAPVNERGAPGQGQRDDKEERIRRVYRGKKQRGRERCGTP